MPHIDLTRGVDAIIVAPATAHFLAKTALGLADDLLSTMVLARSRTTPLLVAPAMNVEMWENPATQRNVAQLAATVSPCSARERQPGLRRNRHGPDAGVGGTA